MKIVIKLLGSINVYGEWSYFLEIIIGEVVVNARINTLQAECLLRENTLDISRKWGFTTMLYDSSKDNIASPEVLMHLLQSHNPLNIVEELQREHVRTYEFVKTDSNPVETFAASVRTLDNKVSDVLRLEKEIAELKSKFL